MKVTSFGVTTNTAESSFLCIVIQFGWEYGNITTKKGAITKSVTYQLLMDSHISDFHVLVREIKHHTHNQKVKVRKEYTVSIEELELGLKKIKLGRPFYIERGKNL